MNRSIKCLFIAALISTVGSGISAQTADWQKGAPASWMQVLERARSEGKVIVGGPEALAKPMTEAFKRDTGVNLEYLGGSSRDLSARLNREARAKSLTIDLLLGGGSELLTLYPEKLLEAIKPQLMLPTVTGPENWIDGKLKWMDKEEAYFFQGSNWVFGWAVVNPTLVPQGTLRTWKDLLKPQFQGKIVAFDPRSGGPGQAAANYVAEQFGPDYLKALFADQRTVYTRDGRQLVEWIARGSYAIGLGAVASDIELFRSQGIRTMYIPDLEDGPGSLLGGFSVIKQPIGAPHPNASTVFLNWYASQRGQTVFSSVMLEPSLRIDVSTDNMPDYIKPKQGLSYIDQYVGDWYLNTRPQLDKIVTQTLGGP